MGRGWVTQTVIVDSVGVEGTNYHVVNFTRLVDQITVRGGSSYGRGCINRRRWTIRNLCRSWAICDPWYPHLVLAHLRYVYLKGPPIVNIRPHKLFPQKLANIFFKRQRNWLISCTRFKERGKKIRTWKFIKGIRQIHIDMSGNVFSSLAKATREKYISSLVTIEVY